MSERINRFLGDSPGRVLVKLIVVSLVVGVVMNAFDWSPIDILYSFENFIRRIWNLGFGARRGGCHSLLHHFAPTELSALKFRYSQFSA
jgi:hypothetical protein